MRSPRAAVVAALLLIAVLAGCAKRPAATTPVPPAPTTTTNNPAPPPEPVPTPPPPVPVPENTGGATIPAGQLKIVYFGYDSFTLDESARAALDQNARVLREHSGATVSLDGHCDERGTVEYNQALGEKRAEAVQQYLADAGIPSARLRVISYGKERPADEGHDESSWAKNRRVEFTPQ
jgi:peptidoglycan-associated lipoprotein